MPELSRPFQHLTKKFIPAIKIEYQWANSVSKHKPTFAKVFLHLSNQRYIISQKIKLIIRTIYHHSSYQNCRSGPRCLQFSTLLYLKEKISLALANFKRKKNLIYFKKISRPPGSDRRRLAHSLDDVGDRRILFPGRVPASAQPCPAAPPPRPFAGQCWGPPCSLCRRGSGQCPALTRCATTSPIRSAMLGRCWGRRSMMRVQTCVMPAMNLSMALSPSPAASPAPLASTI